MAQTATVPSRRTPAPRNRTGEVVVTRPDILGVLINAAWFVEGVLFALLGMRFVLALLGANPGNAFANFIYTVSHPFVAPFFSLFSYNYRYGLAHFEAYTLVAMVVYFALAWIVTALLNIPRNRVVDV